MAPKTYRSLALLVALAPGCAGLLPTPPAPPSLDGYPLARLARVADRLYRSSQPNEADLRHLHDAYGVDIVVKLNGHEAREPVVAGVTVIDEPVNVEIEPSAAQTARLLAAIDAALNSGHTVLIHCTHGQDRTGWLVFLWEISHDFDVSAAYGDLMWRGFHPYRGLWRSISRALRWRG